MKNTFLVVLYTILVAVIGGITVYDFTPPCADLDVNCDGVINLTDVSIFSWRIEQIAPTPAPVPEVYHPTANYSQRDITWVVDPVRVRSVLNDQKRMAAGVASYTIEKCTIYAFEPEKITRKRDFEILGHEFVHCMRGEFHNEHEN